MEGFNSGGSLEDRGIIPRAIEQIFQHIETHISARMRFLVRASYLQIYNENISDLLKPDRNNLAIREDKKRGVFVEGLSEWVVRSPEEIYGLMERGGAMRATGSTKMNEISSRSHAVFIIIAEQSTTTYVDKSGQEISFEDFTQLVTAAGAGPRGDMSQFDSFARQSFKVGKLNLVDLAGSERVRLSGATGQRLEESKNINKSLSAIGNVISALTEKKGRQHIPYRDSKLTRILEDSLGGNCRTTMMAMISPALESIVETLSTLKFANRAKNIKNEAHVNEDLDQKSLLRKYERELKKLRGELEKRNRNVVDKRRLLELDEQRRRAEQDKMTAIRALEERSQEFMREKEEKRKLEKRIQQLTSQMLTRHHQKGTSNAGPYPPLEGGDDKYSDDPHFRNALQEHQEVIRAKYEHRLADLEKERETIEEEKAQVDRYKQLLLKQRDIMIALTQRLNERDEQIMGLQDELDAYDRHQKVLEEKLDEKTAQLIHLQRVIMEHNATSPTKSSALTSALGEWGGKARRHSSTEGIIHPTLLMSHKQFERYGTSVEAIEVDDGVSSMLSAQEKITELTTLLQATQTQNLTLKSQLRTPAPPSVPFELQNKVLSLEQTVKELKTEKYKLETVHKQDAAQAAQWHGIENKCQMLVKERKAVETIMEHKIKSLVDAVARASSSTIAGGTGASEAGATLQREVAALQRLVNASIVALRNASEKTTVTPSGSSRPSSSTTAQSNSPRPEKTATSARTSTTTSASVERLIQQRRLQLQKTQYAGRPI